ncbi:MAG: RES family NAD+ phosphorylase [Cryobacterium sp.]
MTLPDLEFTANPGQVWRVGYKPDPWAWTDWVHATDEGRFNGRWDDKLAEFRTIYTGESLVACLLELLAQFRPDPVANSELDEIEDPDGSVSLYPDAPSGTVGYKWLERHIAGSAQQTGRYCFVTHSKTIAALQASFPFAKFDQPGALLDASILKDASRRGLTRSIARWLYDLRDTDQNDLVDGVEFRSRFGDELRIWAVFERLPDKFLHISQRIDGEEILPLDPDGPAMRHVFELHGLRWKD